MTLINLNSQKITISTKFNGNLINLKTQIYLHHEIHLLHAVLNKKYIFMEVLQQHKLVQKLSKILLK
jgi:hypothetical protein